MEHNGDNDSVSGANVDGPLVTSLKPEGPKLVAQQNETAVADDHFRVEHLKLDLGRRTARGGALMIGSQAVKFAITMVTTVVLARLLTPTDYGLIGMVLVFTGFMTLFKSMGLSAATMQRTKVTQDQISTLFWINMVVGFGLMFLTAALAPVVAWFYSEPTLVWITLVLSVGFALGGITVQHEALLKRQMRFGTLAAIELISMVIGIACGIILAWYGARFWALVWNQLIALFIYSVGVWITCSWRPGMPKRNSGIKSMVVFGRNLTGNNIINYFARNLDNLLIGRMWGPQQLGLYARAYQLLLLPMDQTTVPLDGVAVPALSRLIEDPERYRNAYLRLLEKIAVLTMPLVAFMVITADWLVDLMLGAQWSASGQIFAFLGIFGLFEPVLNTMGWLLISQGRTRHIFQLGVINGTITIFSIIAGLPWGAVGVAVSYSAIGVFIRTPLIFWRVGGCGPVSARDLYRTIAPSVLAALGVLGALWLLRQGFQIANPVVGLPVCALVAALVGLLILSLFASGRTALLDVKNIVLLLIKRETVVEG